MQREREQVWLIVACVIAAHAVALAATTIVWGYGSGRAGSNAKKIEVAIADPVVKLTEVRPPEMNALGEATGTGKSIATVAAPTPAVSDKPDDLEQAWTRQKPVPLPRPAAQASEAPTSPHAAPAKAAEPFGPASVTAMSPLAAKVPTEAKADSTLQPPSEPTPTPQPAEPAKSTEAAKATEAPPDPAQAAESDLDPFAKEEGVSFSPGGTVARKGREVKLTRPRIDLAFMAEATRISGRDLVVRMSIETDTVGHPARVSVLDSSGSDVIDDAVRLAMYDSWFGGKMPDRFPFTVRFVRR